MIFLFFFFFSLFCLRLEADRHSAVLKIGVNNSIAPRVFCTFKQPAANYKSRNLKRLLAIAPNVVETYINGECYG